MIKDYEEYKQEGIKQLDQNILNIFDRKAHYLHLMTREELNNELSKRGNAFPSYMTVIKNYLRWLDFRVDKPEKDNIRDLLAEIELFTTEKMYDKVELFSNYDEMLRCLNNYMDEIITEGVYSIDEEMIRIIYTLKWYGLSNDDIISIHLYDVKEDTSEVFVPSKNKYIYIDNKNAMKVIAEGKNKTDVKICIKGEKYRTYPYCQNTLIRTKRNAEINSKTLSNLTKSIKDTRFKANNIMENGVFERLYKFEQETDITIKQDSKEFLEVQKEHKGILFKKYNLFRKNI